MLSTGTLVRGVAALLLLSASHVAAMPTEQDSKPLPNMHVYVRNPDFSYGHSEEMANQIRAAKEHSEMVKRSSSATVKACRTSSCTDCHTVFSGTFTSGTSCIPADNTACLIISDGKNANVEFWNHAACNGNNSDRSACSKGPINVSAPGTNSLGVHPGC